MSIGPTSMYQAIHFESVTKQIHLLTLNIFQPFKYLQKKVERRELHRVHLFAIKIFFILALSFKNEQHACH